MKLGSLAFKASAPFAAGLVTMGALLPLRDYWIAQFVLLGLALTVPGLLLLRVVRLSREAVKGFPVYVPAASLVMLLAGGLLANEVGPLVGVDRPLHGLWTAGATLGLSLVMLLVGLWSPASCDIDWRRFRPDPLVLAPLLIPLVSGAGALALNNGHDGTVAVIGLALAVFVFITALLAAEHMSHAQLGAIIFGCGLAATWSYALRSHFPLGFDISTESYLMAKTHAAGIWHPSHRNDAYGAMLSVTQLPSTLRSLTGIEPLFVLKVIYPALVALVPVGAYLLASRFLDRRYALGAAGTIVASNYFFQLLPQLARQEVGLVLFAALTFAMYDGRLPRSRQVPLVALLASGMVLSHYSTVYLTILILAPAMLIQLAISRFRGVPAASIAVATALVSLIVGAGVWYGAVTHSTQNVSDFFSTVQDRGVNLLPGASAEKNVTDKYVSGNVATNVGPQRFEREAQVNYRRIAKFIRPLSLRDNDAAKLVNTKVPAGRARLPKESDVLQLGLVVVSQLLLVLAGIGALMLALGKRTDPRLRQFAILGLASLFVLAIIRFSGTAATAYNQERALIQMLIPLGTAAAWPLLRLGDRWQRLRPLILVGVMGAFAVLFFNTTGLRAFMVNRNLSVNLANHGEDYERLYVFGPELASARWVNERSIDSLLYADRYAALRLLAGAGRNSLNFITPATLDRNAWVYGSRTNIVLGRTRGQVNNNFALYRWPLELDAYYDTVYTNGTSAVLHGTTCVREPERPVCELPVSRRRLDRVNIDRAYATLGLEIPGDKRGRLVIGLFRRGNLIASSDGPVVPGRATVRVYGRYVAPGLYRLRYAFASKGTPTVKVSRPIRLR